jgi:hypothetical protein
MPLSCLKFCLCCFLLELLYQPKVVESVHHLLALKSLIN